MPTSLRIVDIVYPDTYAAYLQSAPGSIGHRIIVFQITPDTANDIPAYKRVYDSLNELSTFGIIHNHQHQCLPPLFHTLCVFPLGINKLIPCCLKNYVKRRKLIFKFVFEW
jgi:hypothetical protein